MYNLKDDETLIFWRGDFLMRWMLCLSLWHGRQLLQSFLMECTTWVGCNPRDLSIS